ncbi:mRNA-capping enzyme-like [Hibiscus syriacus]|uniref:mRNA-capping enzyme-like n=1 Tax=Hibiscus syriacus TaxID=106335 RepID=UPI0019221520|nr:mRNA-capping enzyme-like [Hibiscus syriacus]
MEMFAQARPPGIYKPDYIDDLYAFYNESKPADFAYPSPPRWTISPNAASNTNRKPKADPAMKNDDVLGDRIPFNQVKSLRESCYKLMNLHDDRAKKFPGSHPVSLNRENLQLFRQHYYHATWKADGTRYMMLITLDGCYLIDRNFYFRRVQMRFPCSCRKRTHHYTLLDGEMVTDTLPVSQNKERRFLVFDIITCNGNTLMEKPFFERWDMVEKDVIEPRNRDQTKTSCYRYDMELFRVQRKDFWSLPTVPKILNEFIPKLCHEADGLIFQGREDPYIPYTHEGLLKWKYAEMNSVDFLFETGVDDDQKLFLHERGRKKLMEGQKVEFRDGLDPKSCSGMIIECCWDNEEQLWVYMRKRSDKSNPNDFNTYMKVMRSINDNITADILLKGVEEIIRLPMYKHPRTTKLSFKYLHIFISVFLIIFICYMKKD